MQTFFPHRERDLSPSITAYTLLALSDVIVVYKAIFREPVDALSSKSFQLSSVKFIVRHKTNSK